MVSQSAEYALRAVVCLAAHNGTPLATARIAEQAQIPQGYLAAKILPALARAGLIESSPGRAGGVRLARAAAEISLLDVIRAVDRTARILCCPLGLKSHAHELCPLHRRLDQAAALAEQAFAETKIAEILVEWPFKPFCESA